MNIDPILSILSILYLENVHRKTLSQTFIVFYDKISFMPHNVNSLFMQIQIKYFWFCRYNKLEVFKFCKY